MRKLQLGIKALAQQRQINLRQKAQPKLLSLKPAESSQGKLQQKVGDGLKRLSVQAEHINQLATELETAILELKALTSAVNRDLQEIQSVRGYATNLDICEFKALAVPHVAQTNSGSLILKLRQVKLSQEEEQIFLKKVMQRRIKKKRG
jgi:hypothetical protein